MFISLFFPPTNCHLEKYIEEENATFSTIGCSGYKLYTLMGKSMLVILKIICP
jgi:hypothetical protein